MRDTKQTTNKNITYIVIFTVRLIIVVALLIIFIPKRLGIKILAAAIHHLIQYLVMSAEGSQDETISKSIKNLTDVKFGSKRKIYFFL